MGFACWCTVVLPKELIAGEGMFVNESHVKRRINYKYSFDGSFTVGRFGRHGSLPCIFTSRLNPKIYRASPSQYVCMNMAKSKDE